jgi:hypothetical protein
MSGGGCQLAKIRISKKDKEEFNRLRKNALSKMRRLRTKYGIDVEDIPLPNLQSFETRKQFNEWKEEIQRFTSRYVKDYKVFMNEKGTPLLGKEIREFEENNRKAIENAEARVQRLKEILGPDMYKEHLIMKPAALEEIPELYDINRFENRRHFKLRAGAMERRATEQFFKESDERMLENFIEKLSGSFHSYADPLIDKLNKMDPGDFYEVYMKYQTEMTDSPFDFSLYDSEGQDVEADFGHLVRLTTVIDDYLAGKVQLPMKGFPNK